MKAQNSDISAILALKAARAVLGMTQDEVAKASGVSKPTVARLEAMLGKTNLSTIVALLSVYRERGGNQRRHCGGCLVTNHSEGDGVCSVAPQ